MGPARTMIFHVFTCPQPEGGYWDLGRHDAPKHTLVRLAQRDVGGDEGGRQLEGKLHPESSIDAGKVLCPTERISYEVRRVVKDVRTLLHSTPSRERVSVGAKTSH